MPSFAVVAESVTFVDGRATFKADAETLCATWAAYFWLRGYRRVAIAITIPQPPLEGALAYVVLGKTTPKMRARCVESPHLPPGFVAFDPTVDAGGRAPPPDVYGSKRTVCAWLGVGRAGIDPGAAGP